MDSRSLYLSRINRVMDYIEANMDEDLTLDSLAQVAHFSPFHFHRLFQAIVGETLGQFIGRVRMERAAGQLTTMPNRSITDIALSAGFASPATFARAFKQYCGMSASQWRDQYSNPCKVDSSPGKETYVQDRYHKDVAAVKQRAANTMNQPGGSLKMLKPTSTSVSEVKPFSVAYVRHIGPYKGNSKLFEELWARIFRWAGPRDLIGKDTKMLCVYHDSPEITDESRLRTSVCLSVPDNTEVSGEVGKMTIPGGKCAFIEFVLPPDQYQAAWNYAYAEWLPSSGYEPDDGTPYELYGQDSIMDDGRHRVTICIPVKLL